MEDITLKHKVELSIGEENFSLEVHVANAREKKILKALFKAEQKKAQKSDKERKDFEKNQKKLASLQSELQDNQELYILEKEDEVKRELLFERKKLREDIKSLETVMPDIQEPDYEQMIRSFDVVASKRFELLVAEGDDKERLEKFLKEYEISYSEIFSIIDKKITKSREKK